MIQISILSAYETAREKLFIYMTSELLNQKKYDLKFLINFNIRYLRTFFYALSKQNSFFFFAFILSQSQIFNCKLKLLKQQAKTKKKCLPKHSKSPPFLPFTNFSSQLTKIAPFGKAYSRPKVLSAFFFARQTSMHHKYSLISFLVLIYL